MDAEFEKLINQLLDGDATPDTYARLRHLLESNPELHAAYINALTLDTSLKYQVGLDGHVGRANLLGSGLATREPGSTSAQERVSSSPQASVSLAARVWDARWPKWLAAIAAVVAVALYAYRPGAPDVAQGDKEQGDEAIAEVDEPRSLSRPPEPVATLAYNENTAWGGSPLQVGQSLYKGQSIELRQGTAGISVGFGAEVVARAPCRFTLLGRDRLRLDEGEVIVDVAEWAKGYTVVTEPMDVVDLGTTFSVSYSLDGSATTKVLSGMVRALPSQTRAGQKRSLLLSKGQGLSVDALGNRQALREIPSTVLDEVNLGTLVPYRPVDLHNTGVGLDVGDEDPHWRVVAGPEGFAGPVHAVVCEPGENSIIPNHYLPSDREVSRWVSIPDWRNAEANRVYTFEMSFDLSGYDITTMHLFGRLLADNGIQEVRVNGAPVKLSPWLDRGNFHRDEFRYVEIEDGLVAGTNTVEVDVLNGQYYRLDPSGALLGEDQPPPIPNPMAMRVEWYAFGRQLE